MTNEDVKEEKLKEKEVRDYKVIGIEEAVWVTSDMIYFNDLEEFLMVCNKEVALFIDKKGNIHQKNDDMVLIYCKDFDNYKEV